MQPNASQNYLETAVRTASRQKLHLMLVDGALRFCHQAQSNWEDLEASGTALVRAQEVVLEMISVINPEPAPELAKKVAGIYLFIFRRLMEAANTRDAEKLGDAMLILEEERETWQQVCEQPEADHPSVPAPHVTMNETQVDEPMSGSTDFSV